MSERNWAGNHTYRCDRIVHARSVDDVVAAVRDASSVRAVGTRHSFSDIVDAEVLVDLAGVEREPTVDADARTIMVAGASTYADVARVLAPHGLALANLASLPHISVAGAIATATHGSGVRNGNLATAVAGIEYVSAAGELVHVDRTTPDFDGMVVSLGALGLVTGVTLDVVFDYEIEQHVYDDLPLDTVVENLGMILGAAYSASVFTTFTGTMTGQVAQVWLKRRTDGRDQSMRLHRTFLDAPAATMQHHPVPGNDATACTAQLGVPGAWGDRLPHFRMGFTPSVGDEVQSEFFVAAIDGPQALDALRLVADQFVDRLMVAEIRAVAADELWMSPQYRRASVAFHFTWHAGDVTEVVRVVQHALAPFAPRPHWGKVFDAGLFDATETYEMLDDFIDLAHRLDPNGLFRNDWWRRHIEA